MRNWFRRWIRRPHRASQQPIRRRPRVGVEALEDRCLLAAPVIDPIQVPLNIPVGKTLVVPISGSDPAGGSVTYSVTSSNPNVTVQTHPGNTFLKMDVAGFGTMEFELFNDLTPKTAAIIAGMVKSEFYNGLTFHRIIPGFVAQGGDPAGNGTGGPGFTFPDEFNPQLIYSGGGQLAMANSGKDTNGSQFFISAVPTTSAQQLQLRDLDFNNAIFGQLVRGFDVLQAILNNGSASGTPQSTVTITDAQIVQDTSDTVITLQSTGTTTDTTTLTITATSSTGGTTTQTPTANVVADVLGPAGTPTSDPPILNPITDQVSPTGGAVNFTLNRTDLENDASMFKATLVNSADANNVSVTVTPSANNDSATVTVTPKMVNGTLFTGVVHLLVGVAEQNATARGSTMPPSDIFDTQNIAVSFADQPLAFTPATSVGATEGTSAANTTLGTLTDPTTSAVPADYQISINWGDGTPLDTTSGKATATGTAGQFTITGTHTYKEAGNFPIDVKIADVHTSTAGGDNGGATAESTTTASVADAALSGATGGTISATAGTPLNNAVVATFNDADPNAKAGDYTATINWGDGSPSTSGTVQATATTGQFQVLGSHTYATAGSFKPFVSITDVNTAGDATPATASATATATVSTPAQVPQTPTVGPTLSRNLLYVEQLFADLIGTPPTAQQLNQFSSQLDGGASRASVVQAIQALPGYKSHRISQAYQLLGLAATTTQVSDGVGFLNGGGKIGQLRIQIMSSAEYFRQTGGTDTGFAAAAGKAILGHTLTGGTQTHFLQLVSNQGREAAVRALFRTHAQEVRRVGTTTQYQLYLRRAPSPTELSTQVANFTNGQTEDQLIAALVASDEYFNLAQRTASPVTTNMSLISSANPSPQGQSVTFTAAVSSAVPGAGTPTGTVTFTDQTTGTTLGTDALDATGTATFSTSSLSGGSHTIVASYGGDSRFSPSTATTTQTVSLGATTTAVAASPSSSSFGQSVSFTATVTPSVSGGPAPTGTVTFLDQATNATLATAPLSGGQASFSTSSLSVGSHTIVANYGGDSNYGGSSGNTTETVGAATTSTTASASPSTQTFGQQVTLMATVTATSSGAPTPSGTVTFTDQATSQPLGTGTLNSSGVATVNVSSLSGGAHTIVATYGATTNFASSSGTTNVTITAAATTTTVSGDPNPSDMMTNVAITAHVTSSAGVPAGMVTFVDQSTTPATTLGNANLDSNGNAMFTTTTPFTDGMHTIQASYAGNNNFAQSSGTYVQQVNG
jgi:cyclophilin family peptidyl-prolyl cis-trans isomerase